MSPKEGDAGGCDEGVSPLNNNISNSNHKEKIHIFWGSRAENTLHHEANFILQDGKLSILLQMPHENGIHLNVALSF
jgi:hypothetical protein